MKISRRKLDHKGILHHIAPILVVVAVGLIGVLYLKLSHADTAATAGTTGLLASDLKNGAGQIMCLDDYKNGTADRTPVNVFPCNRSDDAQNWTRYSDGTIRIHGKCLDVKGAASTNGTVIEIYTCNGGANQKWTPGTDPHLSLNDFVSADSGKCLDDFNYGTDNNNPTQLYTCIGNTAQVWGWVKSSDPLVLGGDTANANCYGLIVGGSSCYYWVQAFQQNNDNFSASGISVTMSQPDPVIGREWPGGGVLVHTVAEISAASAGGKQAIEFGWYKDSTRLHPIIFATQWINGQFDGYVENGGTGFVPVSSSVHIGDYVPVGNPGDYKIELAGSQWQLWYNGVEVGYFPQSLWTSKGATFNSIGHIDIFGEISSDPFTVSKTQMGNGTLGSDTGSSVFKNYTLINSTVPAQFTNFGEPQGVGTSAYSYGNTSNTSYRFGGPGL